MSRKHSINYGLLMLTGMLLLFSPVSPALAQQTAKSNQLTLSPMVDYSKTWHYTLHLNAGNSTTWIPFDPVLHDSATTSVDIHVKAGERVILSYEILNADNQTWTPVSVKLFDKSYKGPVDYSGIGDDVEIKHRYTLSGYHMQSATSQKITINAIPYQIED